MKYKLKKILIVLSIISLISIFILPTITNYGSVFAANPDLGQDSLLLDILMGVLGLFIGLTTLGTRLKLFAVGLGVSSIVSSIAKLGSDLGGSLTITPVNIFFNQLEILDVNFFNFDPNLGPDSIILQFRTTIATWYYIMRLLATAILLLVLMYVGIRMAISTVASDKALYKKMLVDWIASIALIYVLHYFIILIITLNGLLVDVIADAGQDLFKTQGIDTFQWDLMINSLQFVDGFTGIVCTILYLFIIWQTIKFLFLYFKRMMTVGFLIIIAPLITLTYSLDKMGDGKAQALGTWTKEFCYNILIQPFHCILYLAFVNVAMQLLNDNVATGWNTAVNFITPANATDTIGSGILAIMCLNFIDKGEEIIRNIFGFKNASSLTSAVAAAGAVTAMAGNAKNLGQSGAKMVQGARNSAKLMGQRFGKVGGAIDKATSKIESRKDNKLNKKAERMVDSGKSTIGNRDANGNELTRDERVARQKEALAAQAAQKAAEKAEKKENSKVTKFKRSVGKKASDAKSAVTNSKMAQTMNKKVGELSAAVKRNTVERYRDHRQSKNADRKASIQADMLKAQLGDHATQAQKDALIEDPAFQKEVDRVFDQKYGEGRKERIRGAVGNFTTKAGGGFKAAGNFVKTSFKNDLPNMAAYLGFTANLAGTGNVVTSMIAAAGAYDATETAMKNSKGTIVEGMDKDFQNLENAAGGNIDDRASTLQGIMQLGDAGALNATAIRTDYSGLVSAIQDVLKRNASSGTDAQKNAANAVTQEDIQRFVNRAQTGFNNGAGVNQAVADGLADSKLKGLDVSSDEQKAIEDKMRQFLSTVTKAGIYQRSKTGMSMGLDAKDMAGSERKQSHYFAPGAGPERVVKQTTVTEETNVRVDTEQSDRTIDQINEEARRQVQEIEQMITQIEQDLDNAAEDITIEDKMNRVVSSPQFAQRVQNMTEEQRQDYTNEVKKVIEKKMQTSGSTGSTPPPPPTGTNTPNPTGGAGGRTRPSN